MWRIHSVSAVVLTRPVLFMLQVSDIACSHDGRFLFTVGGTDCCVNMWRINYSYVYISVSVIVLILLKSSLAYGWLISSSFSLVRSDKRSECRNDAGSLCGN